MGALYGPGALSVPGPRPSLGAWRGEAAAAVATPWSFPLLLAFLLLLYANLPLLVPALEPFAPAQSIAVAALAVLFVERSLARRPFRLAWPESHLLLAFVAVAALSAFGALWPSYAIEQTLVLLKFVAIYALVLNTVESWRRLHLVFAAMSVGGLFPAFGALDHVRRGELIEGRAGWIGIFGNPNDLAFGLVMLFPLALCLALAVRGWRRAALVGALAAFAAAVFLTYSRGGLAAFSIVLLLCLLRWGRPWMRIPGLLALWLVIAYALPSYWGRNEGFTELVGDATANQRLQTLRIGLAMFADKPLLGVGLGCSLLGWPLYAPPTALTQGWLHSHNTLIQVASETGILGTLALGLAVGSALWKAGRLARLWRATGHLERYRAVSALEISLWGFVACGLGGGYVLSWFPYLVLGMVSAAHFLPGPEPGELAPQAESAVRD